MQCPDYPVMTYTLVLEDSQGNRSESSLSRNGSTHNVVVTDELMENSQYTYFIMATNVIGSSQSAPVKISN